MPKLVAEKYHNNEKLLKDKILFWQ